MMLSSAPGTPATHVMSIDVEDYFQVEAFSGIVPRESWGSYPLRVEENVHIFLDLLDEHAATATFFFLGWIAHRLPHLVREVVTRGHEVACHSYWHRPIFQLSPAEFRSDTRDALHVIEDAAGIAVEGYRAPTWSITRESMWALNILHEEGFLYDSSIYPIHHDLYGIPGARREPYAWRCGNGFLFEFPPSTLKLGPMTAPAAGGGYLRIFPLRYTTVAMDRAAAADGMAVVYLHPWELDPEQPRIAGPWKSRFRHYTGLDRMRGNLIALLSRYRFSSFANMWRMASVQCTSVSLPPLQHTA
jgi:polysaccharide deacetylase family protein (PEP-CTERM system associated)